MSTPTTLADRARGALLGLAAGDALGTTLEFTGPLAPFAPRVTAIVGGGPFALPPGGWTDDTSMALCLGQSLVAVGGCDPRDQIERYVRWWQRGENSVTGRCFDIGNATRGALQRFLDSDDPLAGDPSPSAAGNGSLMRLAPVALAATSEAQAVEWAALQSRTTHAAREAVDGCRFYARLLWRALGGAPKQLLLDPAAGDLDLAPAVAAVVQGSYRAKAPPAIRGTGYVVDALEQLAGAHYGLAGILAAWRRLWCGRIRSSLLLTTSSRFGVRARCECPQRRPARRSGRYCHLIWNSRRSRCYRKALAPIPAIVSAASSSIRSLSPLAPEVVSIAIGSAATRSASMPRSFSFPARRSSGTQSSRRWAARAAICSSLTFGGRAAPRPAASARASSSPRRQIR